MPQFINIIHGTQIWKQTSRKMVMVAEGQVQDASHPTIASTIIAAPGTSRNGLRSTDEAPQLVD